MLPITFLFNFASNWKEKTQIILHFFREKQSESYSSKKKKL